MVLVYLQHFSSTVRKNTGGGNNSEKDSDEDVYCSDVDGVSTKKGWCRNQRESPM